MSKENMKRTFLLALVAAVCVLAHPGFGMHITLGMGKGKAPQMDVWSDPTVFPRFRSESNEYGYVEVITGEVMRCVFYRHGVPQPEYECQYATGATKFVETALINGKLHRTATWTYERDGYVTMELMDDKGNLLARDRRFERKSEDGQHTYIREEKGDVIVEKECVSIPGYGSVLELESRGTGTNRVWTRTTPYMSGPAKGRCRSTIDSDGYWAIYEYEPFDDGKLTRKIKITERKDDAKAITNATGLVVAFRGTAVVTEMSYTPIEREEEDRMIGDYDPRVTFKYELTDDGRKKPLSRRYHAGFVRDGSRYDIDEEAKTPDSPYGAEGNERWTRCYHWNDGVAGNLKYAISPDGEMEVYDTRYFQDGDTIVRVREKYKTTVDHPEPTPYETMMERGIYDLHDFLLREEKWIALEGGDRELVEWKNYTRNVDGNVLKSESSSGKVVENEWSRYNLVRSVDESGEVRNYTYDAIDRMTHADAPMFDENMRYDLGSQLTNLYGSVFGRRHDIHFFHDDAGTLRDVTSDEGDVEKTVEDADGSTKTYVNGQLVMTRVRTSDDDTTIYYGPKGRESPRWRRSVYDYEHKMCIYTYPCVGGEVVSVTNDFGGTKAAMRERSRPRVRYVKRRGVWWADTEMDGKVTRRRMHPSSDGFDETVYVDEKGFERSVSTKVDRAAAETVTIERRPESGLPSVSVCTNGELALHVSFSGVTNVYERGFQGRLVARRDGRGGVERWTYDAQGREATHTDMNGQRREYEYDARGRIVCVREDGRPPHRYIRDSLGRIVEESAGEKSAIYLYDEYGDMASVECRRGGNTYMKIGFFRDESTGLVTNRVVNGRGVGRSYDKFLKMVSIDGLDIESHMTAFTNGLEVVRDDFGRPLSYSVCGRRMLEKSYDARTGRVCAFSVAGIDGEAKLSYLDGSDLVSSIVYPNGVVADLEYDAEGELVKVSYAGLPSVGREFRRVSDNEDDLSVESLEDDDSSIVARVGRVPLAEDRFVYFDFNGCFERPVAEIGEDGKPRWCLIDADLNAKGVLP